MVVVGALGLCVGAVAHAGSGFERTIGSQGSGEGQFQCPWGIALDGAGHIVVSESSGHLVQVLRYSDGTHVRSVGSSGPFVGPSQGVAADGREVLLFFTETVLCKCFD